MRAVRRYALDRARGAAPPRTNGAYRPRAGQKILHPPSRRRRHRRRRVESFALGGVTFSEVFDALATLYPEAARLAARRLSPEKIADLRKVRTTLALVADEDHEATVDSAVAFFQQIAKGLDNRVMLAMLQSLNLMIGESLRHVIARAPKAKDRILSAQKKLVEAFEARDGDLAAEWMRKHIADLKRGYDVADVDLDEAIL